MFERLLIDSDWAINNGNWMWLSCSSFFYQALPPPFVSIVSLVMLHILRRCFSGGGFQYNRIYSPVSFGKKYDPEGKYIRHFLPVLKGN